MQDFSLQITKSRKSVQRNEERVREGEKRIALWKLPPLVEIRKPSGFPQRLGKHKTLSTVPTRPTCILFFKTLREARSTLNTLLFGPKDGEHLTLYAALVVIGWSSWNDFKKSIDDFNQNVKPLIQQAKRDAQDASDAARSAKNQIKETTDEENRQLEAVKKSNGTIEELQRELKQLRDQVNTIQRASPNTAQNPPPMAQKCEAEVHVQSPPLPSPLETRDHLDFGEQKIGTVSAPLI